VVTGTAHSVEGDGGLEYRFIHHLGLALPDHDRRRVPA
jgi:hypothetical protein